MQATARTLVVLWSAVAVGSVLLVATANAATSTCSTVLDGAAVAAPTHAVAWRAGIEGRTAMFDRVPGVRLRPSRWLTPRDAPWLLVLSRPRAADRRCWLRIRLPWRPNYAAGWINANNVTLEKTVWRIEVSTTRRTLTLLRAGAPIRTIRVVVGKPSTPTPDGLFAITWAIPWKASDFLGSWVLELTGHSDALHHFDGGDGTVGIHGRGGASLLDPLGSAASHGCVRLANRDIGRLVRAIGRNRLPGTPVQIT